MYFVLDASSAAELVMDRPQARKIEHVLSQAERILVPELFICEITNVFWKYHVLNHVSILQCKTAIEQCLEFPDEFISGTLLFEEAYTLASKNKIPAYDMFYLALAKRYHAALVTLDKTLLSTCKKEDVLVY